MRRFPVIPVFFTFILLNIFGAAPFEAFAGGATFYVSPTGNDAWSGKSPARKGADGPFATIGRAQKAVREMRTAGNPAGPVTVFLRGGRYEIAEPLVFTPEDSGMEQFPVTWAAYQGEKPIISGGKRITGWKSAENGRWTAQVPGVREGQWKFRQLYVNGESRKRARIPNEGFLRIAGTPDGGAEVNYATPARRFVYKPDDIDPNWRNLSDIEITVLHYWVDVHLPIAAINADSNMVTFQRKSARRLTDDFNAEGARYFVDNVYEGLDQPGEWYLDRASGVLTYLPKPGEDMKTAEVVAPFVPKIVEMRGEPEKLRFVERLAFRGIAFMHVNFDLSPDDAGDLQAANTVPGGVFARGMRNCAFESCAFRNMGTYAIQLAEGCADNRISDSEIVSMGAGGIRVGGGTEQTSPLLLTGGTVITDNHIHNLGEVFPSAVGVWLGNTNGNLVAHNEIDHLYYTGVSVGWVWGYSRSVSRDNVIEYNHIHDVGQGMLSDMGGVYLLGVAPGTKVRNNRIHHIESHGYGGWGIYTDEGSTHVIIENNVVYRTKCGGFNQHYGRENTVRNNILAYSRENQISRGRVEGHISFYFERNIVYWEEGPLLSGNWDFQPYDAIMSPYGTAHRDSVTFVMDYNLYWNPKASADTITFAGRTFNEWKARGLDIHSLMADPLFVDPAHDDFTLRPESPAFALGFRPIDLRDVGPSKKK
jgi:hypothetical protein